LPRRVAEIGAGTERLALRGENGSPDFDVPIEFLQRVGDLVDQRDVEEIQRRLADLDQADVTVLLDTDVRKFAHVVVSECVSNCIPAELRPLSHGRGWKR